MKGKYCDCESFPCARLKHLDKRYRTRYNMSMIENLQNIKENGIREFVKSQKHKYTCKKCGGAICVHRDRCLRCEKKKD